MDILPQLFLTLFDVINIGIFVVNKLLSINFTLVKAFGSDFDAMLEVIKFILEDLKIKNNLILKKSFNVFFGFEFLLIF